MSSLNQLNYEGYNEFLTFLDIAILQKLNAKMNEPRLSRYSMFVVLKHVYKNCIKSDLERENGQ